MATQVRLGNSLPLGLFGESKVINIRDVVQNEVMEADQILVGRNKTRFTYNRRLRELHGRLTPYPEAGDRIVCLRNNHELGLLNGAIWDVNKTISVDDDLCRMNIEPQEGGAELTVEAHSLPFLGKGADIPWWERKSAEEFDYGYALTCHKAQGSQWDNVLLFDESYCFRKDRNKWLYTAVTRAAKRVTIVNL
jgi:exodeoxyribonuclease-5